MDIGLGIAFEGGVTITRNPPPPTGQQAYTTAGTFSWTAPAGVTSVSVVAIGAGGGGSTYGGGGGGGLGWKNNITVVPGNTYTVRVGAGGNDGPGGDSYFINDTTVKGGGAPNSYWAGYLTPNFGTFVGDGGGNGGNGGRVIDAVNGNRGGGGGAGGYSGTTGATAGGSGGVNSSGGAYGAPTAGTGGGGGGGWSGGTPVPSPWTDRAQGGGGVGILGQGTSGAAGGVNGGSGGDSGTNPSGTRSGGLYGGGGANYDTGYYLAKTPGAGGAVRIIWGDGRAFPSTNTADMS